MGGMGKAALKADWQEVDTVNSFSNRDVEELLNSGRNSEPVFVDDGDYDKPALRTVLKALLMGVPKKGWDKTKDWTSGDE